MQSSDEVFSLGISHFQNGNWPAAAGCLEQALAANPKNLDAIAYLANIHCRLRHFPQAVECYQKILASRPEDADSYYNLGNVHFAQGQTDRAIECLRKAVLLKPNFVEAYNNLGIIFNLEDQSDAARSCFMQALSIKNNFADAHNNLGSCYLHQGQIADAEKCYQAALASDPGHKRAFHNLGLLKLMRGHFEEGWAGFELRWLQAKTPPPSLSQPVWDGAEFVDNSLLVYADEGLGDTVQFARYLPFVKSRGGKVVFACQPALGSILQRIDGVDSIVSAMEPSSSWPSCDLQVSLLNLPRLFATTVTTIPAKVLYLRADPAKVKVWREELYKIGFVGTESPKFNVGIIWQGSMNQKFDRRSVPLKLFEKLAYMKNVNLISLQVSPGSEQLAQVSFPVQDLGSRFNLDSFEDAAATMVNLDLVITVDSASAHIAGALGVPTWVALPKVACWRWLLDRVDTPWYPMMRLFRQDQIGEWGPVFDDMALAINGLLAGR